MKNWKFLLLILLLCSVGHAEDLDPTTSVMLKDGSVITLHGFSCKDGMAEGVLAEQNDLAWKQEVSALQTISSYATPVQTVITKAPVELKAWKDKGWEIKEDLPRFQIQFTVEPDQEFLLNPLGLSSPRKRHPDPILFSVRKGTVGITYLKSLKRLQNEQQMEAVPASKIDIPPLKKGTRDILLAIDRKNSRIGIRADQEEMIYIDVPGYFSDDLKNPHWVWFKSVRKDTRLPEVVVSSWPEEEDLSPDAKPPAGEDLLILRNGDELPGTFLEWKPSTVLWKVGEQTVPVDLSRVARVIFRTQTGE